MKDVDQVGFLDGVDVKIEKAFSATRRISGWNSVSRIFKSDDVALVVGSTFLLSVPEDDEQHVVDWMQTVMQSGIGVRRSEGFGRVVFDEPLHLAACENREQIGGPL
jgi:CRISPR-associated protein Csx10